ncbi:hypothetical protein AUEXF2481DRAFT_292610 [Aureobasidium subglaciale EXF-2481]|uniref:Uncharacterized protein n=1 Tax=Aureobasidium subglaciale (strain EXF-2481) TaxID=1043005 RepID=A0A074Y8N6_AURSE|nr:uncharacterized protein AUEXF2481DRAFT_292610 [Aureobasidium subglaciale EXF-2481]KEQ94090.1 hypothetical protein AUEXF2481DRAFT_292610 [Aureobasidium subglaciale EXF-2481]
MSASKISPTSTTPCSNSNPSSAVKPHPFQQAPAPENNLTLVIVRSILLACVEPDAWFLVSTAGSDRVPPEPTTTIEYAANPAPNVPGAFNVESWAFAHVVNETLSLSSRTCTLRLHRPLLVQVLRARCHPRKAVKYDFYTPPTLDLLIYWLSPLVQNFPAWM